MTIKRNRANPLNLDQECAGIAARAQITVTCGDPVNHPVHYTQHPSGVECIQITECFNFNRGNAIKYIWRADLKHGIEDLRKARWYLDREIARVSKCQK